MPAALQPGDLVFAPKNTEGRPALETDWKLLRFEPGTGNAVVEKGSTHTVIPKDLFERFNFSGSREVLATIDALPESKKAAAMTAFVAGDFSTARTLLLADAIELDPAFSGVVTPDDLAAKIQTREEELRLRVEILRKKSEDAQRGYDLAARTGHPVDEVDGKLMTLENVKNQFETEQFRAGKVPEWKRLLTAIRALESRV